MPKLPFLKTVKSFSPRTTLALAAGIGVYAGVGCYLVYAGVGYYLMHPTENESEGKGKGKGKDKPCCDKCTCIPRGLSK